MRRSCTSLTHCLSVCKYTHLNKKKIWERTKYTANMYIYNRGMRRRLNEVFYSLLIFIFFVLLLILLWFFCFRYWNSCLLHGWVVLLLVCSHFLQDKTLRLHSLHQCQTLYRSIELHWFCSIKTDWNTLNIK